MPTKELIHFEELKAKIEKETGFYCFEDSLNVQPVFYGLSANFSSFKDLVKDYIKTGTMVVLIDTGASHMWSAVTKAFY